MERIISFTKNHWKKFIIGTAPLLYGINYIKNEYQISQHMRNVCNEVNQFSSSNAKNVLVVLNPVANKKKCEKMFKKYCEPVLHMAGYSVEVIKTKHVGHAKSLMETLQKLPDVIVVAGGNGTSSEVVTGLLRRNEEICPILFLPLGEKSGTSCLIKNESKGKSEYVKCLSHSMLTLPQSRVEQRPVIKYELIGDGKENEFRKPIFGLVDFSWGILKDIEIKKDKYWYFGALRHYVSAFITSLSNNMNQSISAKFICTPPCPGCNKCEILVKNKSWLNVSKLLNTQLNSHHTQLMNENKMCSSEKYYDINAKQIDIKYQKNLNSFFELNTTVIENISSRSRFLLDMIKDMEIKPSTSIGSRTIKLLPDQSEYQTYYIDGEGYDARSIRISLLPNSIKCFN